MHVYLFGVLAQLLSGSELPQVKADQPTLTTILTIVFTFIGGIALLLFVIAGLRYVTAQGDPQKIAQAKNQLLYTAIGLVLAASAAAIVNFVIGRA
ncbi:MAG TPA: pilin [Candidatus Saccharimonadales bacterium]